MDIHISSRTFILIALAPAVVMLSLFTLFGLSIGGLFVTFVQTSLLAGIFWKLSDEAKTQTEIRDELKRLNDRKEPEQAIGK